MSFETLWDSINCSMPGFPVHHHLPELAQTHVHWVGDAIQPSHPLSSPSPPVLNLSQHQDLCRKSVFCQKAYSMNKGIHKFRIILTGIFGPSTIQKCSKYFLQQLCFVFLTTPCGTGNFSAQRLNLRSHCSESLNSWTTREFLEQCVKWHQSFCL